MIFGGGTFGRWLDHEAGALMNGISALIKGDPENLNRICMLLLCEHSINLNCVELVHSALLVSCILLLLCTFILLICESWILKLQLKILFIYQKIIVIYSGAVCNFVLYFFKSPVNALSYFHNLKKEKKKITDRKNK